MLSFYRYDDISELLHTKHTDVGYYMYTLLAKLAFEPFKALFTRNEPMAAIGIDERVKEGYSHTAILSRALRCESITPRYAKLSATNDIHYSGKSKAYREANPRNFIFHGAKERRVIVVDDIITTGTTLSEAVDVIVSSGYDVEFCVTLAYV